MLRNNITNLMKDLVDAGRHRKKKKKKNARKFNLQVQHTSGLRNIDFNSLRKVFISAWVKEGDKNLKK